MFIYFIPFNFDYGYYGTMWYNKINILKKITVLKVQERFRYERRKKDDNNNKP